MECVECARSKKLVAVGCVNVQIEGGVTVNPESFVRLRKERGQSRCVGDMILRQIFGESESLG